MESRERKGKGRREAKVRRGFFSSCGEWELRAESVLWYRRIILFHREKKRGQRRERFSFLGVSGFIGVDNGAWSTEQQRTNDGQVLLLAVGDGSCWFYGSGS